MVLENKRPSTKHTIRKHVVQLNIAMPGALLALSDKHLFYLSSEKGFYHKYGGKI